IGGDSAPAQMASLLNVPVLALIPTSVNFWESGPTSAGSRILLAEQIDLISPQRVSEEAVAMLQGAQAVDSCVIRRQRLQSYELHKIHQDPFCWQLIQALYTGSPFPLL